MNSKSKYLLANTIRLGVVLILAACGTATPALPKATPLPSSTATIPSATSTLTPTLPSITNTPTEKPKPTVEKLLPATAQAKIADLYTTYANCKFPCWWGFTPGKSEWQDAERLLVPFALSIQRTDSPDGSTFYVEVPNTGSPFGNRHIYSVQKGIVQIIDLEIDNLPSTRLSNILLQ